MFSPKFSINSYLYHSDSVRGRNLKEWALNPSITIYKHGAKQLWKKEPGFGASLSLWGSYLLCFLPRDAVYYSGDLLEVVLSVLIAKNSHCFGL